MDRFGWFWECPNGEQCQYRHALPPGFVLKSQKKALEEAEKANAGLVARVKQSLADAVKEVRVTHRLTDSPSCIVTDDHADYKEPSLALHLFTSPPTSSYPSHLIQL